MKNINRARHVAISPNTKQQISKFKQEISEDFSWRYKAKEKDRK